MERCYYVLSYLTDPQKATFSTLQQSSDFFLKLCYHSEVAEEMVVDFSIEHLLSSLQPPWLQQFVISESFMGENHLSCLLLRFSGGLGRTC